jgi:hypothetical protein
VRLYVDVREGDWSVVDHSPYGASISRRLDKLINAGEFAAGDDLGRWHHFDARVRQETFEISIPDTSAMTVGDLKNRCLAEARRTRAALPEFVPVSPGSRFGYLRYGHITDIWLSDSATDGRISDHLAVNQTELADGDLVVLSIKHATTTGYMLGAPANPAELLRWLQLAENSTAPAAGPRLWGVLLYTDADVELATYVRTYFDDLNILSGPATRIFVVERRTNWSTAKKYWRRHMEPELYRVMSVMRWLQWTPYDPQGAYEIAALLGVDPELLPCLVFFHSSQGPLYEGEKIVFRIEQTSTSYFRSLFGGVNSALRLISDSDQSPQARTRRQNLERHGPTSEYYDHAAPYQTERYAQAPEAMKNLLGPGLMADAEEDFYDVRAAKEDIARNYAQIPEAMQGLYGPRMADAEAFAAVRAAEEAIKGRLRQIVPSASIANSNNIVIISGSAGAEVSENFHFHGQNTTFINRPQDTIIQDFQNTYPTTLGLDELTRLLQLVLSSRDFTTSDREEAAETIRDVARLGASRHQDLPTARTRLERLRSLLTTCADVAQPALQIVASLLKLFEA